MPDWKSSDTALGSGEAGTGRGLPRLLGDGSDPKACSGSEVRVRARTESAACKFSSRASWGAAASGVEPDGDASNRPARLSSGAVVAARTGRDLNSPSGSRGSESDLVAEDEVLVRMMG